MRWLLVLLLAGCSHASINASGNSSPATVTTGGQASVHVESRSLAALVIAGMFIAAAAEDARDPRPFPSFSSLADWFRIPPAPELDPTRRVSEQDCTRPLDHSQGNIRCK
jgi:hypothetical protein